MWIHAIKRRPQEPASKRITRGRRRKSRPASSSTHAIENFRRQFKSIFDGTRPVPTKGLVAPQRYVLGAVLVYHVALLYRFQTGGSLRAGLKPMLQAA
jgi:hypothetical protein